MSKLEIEWQHHVLLPVLSAGWMPDGTKDLAVALAVASFHSRERGCFASMAKIAERANCYIDTARVSVHHLCAQGLLIAEPRPGATTTLRLAAPVYAGGRCIPFADYIASLPSDGQPVKVRPGPHKVKTKKLKEPPPLVGATRGNPSGARLGDPSGPRLGGDQSRRLGDPSGPRLGKPSSEPSNEPGKEPRAADGDAGTVLDLDADDDTVLVGEVINSPASSSVSVGAVIDGEMVAELAAAPPGAREVPDDKRRKRDEDQPVDPGSRPPLDDGQAARFAAKFLVDRPPLDLAAEMITTAGRDPYDVLNTVGRCEDCRTRDRRGKHLTARVEALITAVSTRVDSQEMIMDSTRLDTPPETRDPDHPDPSEHPPGCPDCMPDPGFGGRVWWDFEGGRWVRVDDDDGIGWRWEYTPEVEAEEAR